MLETTEKWFLVEATVKTHLQEKHQKDTGGRPPGKFRKSESALPISGKSHLPEIYRTSGTSGNIADHWETLGDIG